MKLDPSAWNDTLPPWSRDRLEPPAALLERYPSQSQSGEMWLVKDACGKRATLDPAWFGWGRLERSTAVEGGAKVVDVKERWP